MNVCQVIFGVSFRRTKDASSSELKARPKKNLTSVHLLGNLDVLRRSLFPLVPDLHAHPRSSATSGQHLSFIILIMEAGKMIPAQ